MPVFRYGMKDKEEGLLPQGLGKHKGIFLKKKKRNYTMPPEVCNPYNKCAPSNIHVPLAHYNFTIKIIFRTELPAIETWGNDYILEIKVNLPPQLVCIIYL